MSCCAMCIKYTHYPSYEEYNSIKQGNKCSKCNQEYNIDDKFVEFYVIESINNFIYPDIDYIPLYLYEVEIDYNYLGPYCFECLPKKNIENILKITDEDINTKIYCVTCKKNLNTIKKLTGMCIDNIIKNNLNTEILPVILQKKIQLIKNLNINTKYVKSVLIEDKHFYRTIYERFYF